MIFEGRNMTNGEMAERINEQIHKERDRRIMRRKMIDGITYEALAEEEEMSPRGIQYIVARHRNIFQ